MDIMGIFQNGGRERGRKGGEREEGEGKERKRGREEDKQLR